MAQFPKSDSPPADSAQAAHRWTFLSNHSHVLLCITRDSQARVRDIAAQVGITERAVQRILRELQEAGVVVRKRQGRRNRYIVQSDIPLRHPLEQECTVGLLMETLQPDAGTKA